MDRNQLYQLFNGADNNVLQFAKSTGEYRKWTRFDDEGATPVVAIPELLEATVKMIANLETADVHTRSEMNKYLLQKVEDAATKQTEDLPPISTGLKSKKGRRSLLPAWKVAITLLVIFISGFAIAYFYFGTKNKVAVSSLTNKPATDTAITPLQAENALKKNTVERKTAQKKNNSKKEKAVNAHKTATTTQKEIAAEKDKPTGEIKGKYKIVSKAYFYNEPDESTRRNAFVVHWNNSYATLNALDEENGFVYVVFRNLQNQTSKGWLRKKDLRPVE
jgi:serine/threonine-protein kinase